MTASHDDRGTARFKAWRELIFDKEHHVDQLICRNLTQVTPGSVLNALWRANRARRVNAWTLAAAVDAQCLTCTAVYLASAAGHPETSCIQTAAAMQMRWQREVGTPRRFSGPAGPDGRAKLRDCCSSCRSVVLRHPTRHSGAMLFLQRCSCFRVDQCCTPKWLILRNSECWTQVGATTVVMQMFVPELEASADLEIRGCSPPRNWAAVLAGPQGA